MSPPQTAARNRIAQDHTTPPQRLAMAALLVATAALYLWGLDESGWANSFYSAAAQAGSQSWSAFFFGASDAAGSITVDKTPLSLWPMALSVRLFGLSSWSILVPQALFGVASVWLLARTVRRSSGSAGAGLLAGAILALTPVAVLMFRFNNPDALLTLLLIGSAAATLRAVDETHRQSGHPARWVALGGALVGLAFLAKMLQAFLVLPALALVYGVFAARPLLTRFGHLLLAAGSMLLAGGWWIAIVELWPASSRPWIGGSQTNSILELTLGYNGLGRLTGDEVGSVGGGQGWGETGLGRLFGADLGGQIAWLLPAALILGVTALWVARRDRRTAAALTLWLGWLVVTGLTFSFMSGIFHAYYAVALAPAIAALVAIGGRGLWLSRSTWATGMLAVAMLATTGTSYILLSRTPDWLPWLRYAVVVLGVATAVLMLARTRMPARLAGVVVAAAIVAGLAGPAAYALDTAATPHTGSIPSAGPAVADAAGRGRAGAPPAGGPAAQGQPGGGQPADGAQGAGGNTGGPAGGGDGGRAGGLLVGSSPSAELTELLLSDADSYTWVAAAVGSNSAAGFQLATESSVMPIGGFNGSDPSPTLDEFQALVSDGRIHYFINGGDDQGGGGGRGGGTRPGGAGAGGPGTTGASAEIAAWVTDNFTAQTIDGVTVYDLTGGTA